METESMYRCRCGQPWATMVGTNLVSSSPDDWKLCPVCDGGALAIALLPASMRRDRGAVDDA